MQPDGSHIDWNGISTETYDLAVECLQTNYYGAKRMIEAFLPLLYLSDSPRIVNVSSSMGKLKVLKSQIVFFHTKFRTPNECCFIPSLVGNRIQMR